MYTNINKNLSIIMPSKWKFEENDDIISIYNPNGVGAITISSHKILELPCPLFQYISQIAVEFAKANHIKIKHSFIVDTTNPDKYILSGTGTDEKCFYKIWIISKANKYFIITYNAEVKLKPELAIVNKIIASIKLT